MKFSTAALLSAVLAVIPSQVSAHGFVKSVTIDGKKYEGNDPLGGTKASPIRKISTPNPNYGANNPALNCGPNAKPGSLVADAMPGSKLQFDWAAYPEWPHNTGPVLTYLASCGSTTCDKFDSTKARWFKIHQEGRKSNGKWAQQDIMNGGLVTATLPANLASGNYLVRHEIIALHLAQQKGKAEFYPSCTQIKVGGNQKGVPKASELVSFPGGYSDNDAGIFTPKVFDTGVAYQFPGPPVVSSLVAGSGSDSTPPAPPAESGGSESETPAPENGDNDNSNEGSNGGKDNGGKDGYPDGQSDNEPSGKPPKSCHGRGRGRRHRSRQVDAEPEITARNAEAVPRNPEANDTEIKEDTVNRIRDFHARHAHRRTH